MNCGDAKKSPLIIIMHLRSSFIEKWNDDYRIYDHTCDNV